MSNSTKVIVGGVVAGALVITGLMSVHRQDVGEAKVLRSFSGEVVGESTEPGFHLKAPWVKAIPWDVRDNVVEYAAGGETNYNGGSATGPRITVQDADGVDANLDLTVRYSIAGDKVEELYARFGTQQNLVTKLIEPGIRSATREIPGQYGSLELLNNRADVQANVRDALVAEWAADGIIVEDVSIQEIVQPENVKAAFARAQEARTAVETEKANLERAKIEAEKNAVATQALTPEILTDRYIAALDAGTVFIVPEGSTPMLQLPELAAPQQ
ncbi:prohibitin family protein [Cellulosimicrobium sp. TH-20]|uniref:prohibitin family protein n=1 Tax=Cellulosimicrobium sp. TH-20 TaxID=1980001 RepID=UPI0011A441A3|nr:prohibitin family protein [Cellulosimicrobium sp. TH-20]